MESHWEPVATKREPWGAVGNPRKHGEPESETMGSHWEPIIGIHKEPQGTVREPREAQGTTGTHRES